MTLICFASQKGSPGATATTIAVAAALKLAPGRRKLLLEADTTGGTLAIRYRLPTEPGLLTLAAAVRSGMESNELWRHTQELPGGLPVIVCPDGPEQVNAALAACGTQLGRFLAGLRDVDVLCDVGRLAPSSAALDFVAESSALLMVSRPTAEQLQPAARRMMMVRPHVQNIGWVLIGQKPYGPLEVEQTFQFPVVGVIADDARSVKSLENGVVTKRLRRHPFIRSSSTLADTLSNWLAPLIANGPEVEQPVEEVPQAEPVPVPSSLDLASAPPPRASSPGTSSPGTSSPGGPVPNGSSPGGPAIGQPASEDVAYLDSPRPPERFRGPVELAESGDAPVEPHSTHSTQPQPSPMAPLKDDMPGAPPSANPQPEVAMPPTPQTPQPGPGAAPQMPAQAGDPETRSVPPAPPGQYRASGPPMPPGATEAPTSPSQPVVGPHGATVSRDWAPPSTGVNGQEPERQAGDGLPAEELDDWEGSHFIVTGDLREVFRPPANLSPAQSVNESDGPTASPQGRDEDPARAQPSPFPHEDLDTDRLAQ